MIPIRPVITVDKEVKKITFTLEVHSDCIYRNSQCVEYFKEIMMPSLKIDAILAIMSKMFNLILKDMDLKNE